MEDRLPLPPSLLAAAPDSLLSFLSHLATHHLLPDGTPIITQKNLDESKTNLKHLRIRYLENRILLNALTAFSDPGLTPLLHLNNKYQQNVRHLISAAEMESALGGAHATHEVESSRCCSLCPLGLNPSYYSECCFVRGCAIGNSLLSNSVASFVNFYLGQYHNNLVAVAGPLGDDSSFTESQKLFDKSVTLSNMVSNLQQKVRADEYESLRLQQQRYFVMASTLSVNIDILDHLVHLLKEFRVDKSTRHNQLEVEWLCRNIETLCCKIRVIDSDLKRRTYTQVVVDGLSYLREKVDKATQLAEVELSSLKTQKAIFERVGPVLVTLAHEYTDLCHSVVQAKDDLSYLQRTFGS